MARRLELGLTPKEVVEQANVDAKTYRSLEDGSRWPQERSRLRIEAVLKWQAGGIAELLAGNEPVELVLPESQIPAIPDQSAQKSPTDGLQHVLNHTWGIAQDVVDEVARMNASEEFRSKVSQLVTTFGFFLSDQIVAFDAPWPDRDQALADLYRRRDRANQTLRGVKDVLETAAQSDASAQGRESKEVTLDQSQSDKTLAERFGERLPPEPPRKAKPDDGRKSGQLGAGEV